MPRIADEANTLAANDLAVRAAVARGGKPTEYKIRESDGLTLRVEASGKAAYYARYTAHGKRQRLRLGQRGVMPLKDARQRAKVVALAVERGEDPATAASDRKKSITFGQLWELRKKKGDARSVHTINSYEQALKQYAMDTIGHIPADELTMDRIAGLLREVQAHSPHRAHVVRCAIGSTYRWARPQGHVKTNPTLNLGFVHRAERRRRQVTSGEIATLLNGIDSDHGPSPQMRLLLKIALFTGQRSSTVAGARTDELDLDTANPRWRIGSSRMKNKETDDHVLPLTPAVVTLFKDAIAVNNGSAFVFPSEGEGEHFDVHSVSRAMNRLCTRIGINREKTKGKNDRAERRRSNLRVHDFRKALTTWLAENGVSYDVRARIMHHSPPDVTSRNYDFSMLDGPMRQALQAWAHHVEAVARAEKGDASNVTPMVRKA